MIFFFFLNYVVEIHTSWVEHISEREPFRGTLGRFLWFFVLGSLQPTEYRERCTYYFAPYSFYIEHRALSASTAPVPRRGLRAELAPPLLQLPPLPLQRLSFLLSLAARLLRRNIRLSSLAPQPRFVLQANAC